MTTYLCPHCHEQSDTPDDCSECGMAISAVSSNAAPVTSLQGAGATAATNTARGTAGTSARGQVARVGGYTGMTQRATTARRPQASTAQFTGTRTGRGGGSGSTRHRGSRGSSSRRRALGGGLVQMPIIPSQDPLLKVMVNPSVPDAKCQCPNPACVDKNGVRTQVNPRKKFCSNCGTEYNFRPSLSAGDVVAGQYEIKGAMAFGGLGWIYLGQDRKVNDRWVVLKGLLNSKDEASAAAAVAERQFLAAIKHAKIVGIYNFVSHGGESYIVMEYVGGRTLKELRKSNGPLPPEQAMSYIIGILPAFSYLHEQRLVYCDFSPDNVMLEGEDVKLIDLGATRRISDRNGDIYGKQGYMAPEASYDPYEPSDLFTIGRTLANLMLDMSMRTTGPLRWTVPEESFATRGVDIAAVRSWTANLEGGAALPTWLRFDKASRVLSGQAPSGIMQIAVEITPLDGQGKPLRDKDGNPAVVPMDVVMPLSLPEPQEARFEVPKPAFEAAGLDVTGAVSWTVRMAGGEAMPAWLKWDANQRLLAGRAPDGLHAFDVEVTGVDAQGVSRTLPFTVRLPFAQSESLYRFLLKATAYDPDARFQTAEEMSAQLTGVLREMVARTGPVPAADDPEFLREKSIFGGDPAALAQVWHRLPDLQIDDADTAKAEVFSAGGATSPEERTRILQAAVAKKTDSSEARLRYADLLIADDTPEEGRIMPLLDQAAAIDPWDWRPDWYCGLLRLAQGQGIEAVECFDRVYGDIPGSMPPKLALAMALELAGRLEEAAGLYDTVSRTDSGLTSAAFGLGRCRRRLGDREGAVEAYGRIPSGSITYGDAKLAEAAALSDGSAGTPSLADIQRSGEALTASGRQDIPRHVQEVAVLMQAVALLESGVKPTQDMRVLDVPVRAKDLRLRAERALRTCAKMAGTAVERVAYVDLANSVRPRTTW